MTGAMIPVSGVAFAFVGLPEMGGIDDTCTLREHPDLWEEKHPRLQHFRSVYPRTKGGIRGGITGEYQTFPGS